MWSFVTFVTGFWCLVFFFFFNFFGDWLFFFLSGFELKAFKLAEQALYHLSHSSSPCDWLFWFCVMCLRLIHSEAYIYSSFSLVILFWVIFHCKDYNIYLLFLVLGFELRDWHLQGMCSTTWTTLLVLILCWVFSHELFAWAGFEPQSSWSLPPE
jgi:hypothetical protein